MDFKRDLKEVLSGKDTYLLWPTNKLAKLFENAALVNLTLDMMKFVKPSFYVMRIRMKQSMTILKMSGKCVPAVEKYNKLLEKPSLTFSQ